MQSRGAMDLVGVAGSAICLVHCLAGPLLLLLAPIVPSIVQSDQQFHQSMLFLVVPVSTVAFLIGCGRHRDVITLVFGATAGSAAHAIRRGSTIVNVVPASTVLTQSTCPSSIVT